MFAVPQHLGGDCFALHVQADLGLAHAGADGFAGGHADGGPAHGAGGPDGGARAGDHRGVGQLAGLHLDVACSAGQLDAGAQGLAQVDVPAAGKHHVTQQPDLAEALAGVAGHQLGPGHGQVL